MKAQAESAIVPKQFLTSPFFASKPQKGTRKIVSCGVVCEIGASDPLSDESSSTPPLDIRHGKLLFLMLSKFRTCCWDWDASIHFSICELCRDYFGVYGGREHRTIRNLLQDMRDSLIKLNLPSEAVTFSVFSVTNYREKYSRRDPNQMELWLDEVSLNKRFVELLITQFGILSVRLDELFRMSTPLAAACYTYLPSRAWHHGAEKPFEITLTNLLEQLGEKVPRKKSLRKHKFFRKDERYDIDVVSDLDGAEINCERVLRCEMAETADGKDFKLRLWCETVKRPPSEPKGELWDVWRSGGGTAEEWVRLMSNYSKIEWTPYELDAFTEITDWKKSERFYKMAKCLLGSGFTEELGIVKNALREGADIGDGTVRNSTAYLNYLLIRAVARENGRAPEDLKLD